MLPDSREIGVSDPEPLPSEQDRTGVAGVCALKVPSDAGNSEYDGGGVTGATWEGAIVCGAIDSAGGAIQGIIFPIDMEVGIRSC